MSSGIELTALTTKEQKRLDVLETKIAMAINGFAEAGSALREVRESKLYRSTHVTFEDYCRDVWGLGRNYANKVIAAGSIQELLGTNVPAVPSEGVARALMPLKDKPEELIGAWQRAVEEHGKPTAAQVRAIVTPPAPKAPEPEEEVLTGGEVIDPPVATRVERKALPAPKAERPAGRSSSSLASVTRAVNSALDDGWTLEEIADSIQRTYAGRAT